MKKLVLLLLLFTGMVNAQIINIPDANFKAKLLAADVTNHIAYGNGGYMKIDANNDGQIQETEVSSVDSLNVNTSNIIDLNGISSFTTLKKLNCKYNQIVNLNLSLNTSVVQLNCNNNQIVNLDLTSNLLLTDIYCSNNSLTSLNVSGLGTLFHLFCDNNNLSTLDLSGLILLSYLNCSGNQITNLDVSGLVYLAYFWCNNNSILTPLNLSTCVNLEYVNCSYNQIPSINTTGLSQLGFYYCQYNQLTNLNVMSNSTLYDFDCSFNQIAALDITNSPNLHTFNFSNNQIATLDITNLTNVVYFYCQLNLLANLDVSNLTNLQGFSFGNPGLNPVQVNTLQNISFLTFYGGLQTSLDVSNLASLNQIGVRNSLIESLDFSNNTLLTGFVIEFNPNLTSVNLKNGRNYTNGILVFFYNCPNLMYICAEETSIAGLSTIIGNTGMNANLQVNSYCSFTPGGEHNTISGAMTFDANNNGCDASDDKQSNIRVNINDGTTIGASFTNNVGNYKFCTQVGNFDITPAVDNPTWFTFSPATATIPFANNNNNTVTQDFCITANGVHPDVEAVIAPITAARPGFNAVYKIVYKNKGNQTLSGNVSFSYDDTVLDFVSSTVAPNSQSTGLLTYDYTTLLPFENRSFYITLHVNAPTDSPSVNIGDILAFSATVNPVSGDEIPADNTFQYNQTVIGSFDPNDITCMEGDLVSPAEIGNYLHYVINFENTGTADAENIVVKDIIDTTQYDVSSLQILNNSNPVTARLMGNVAEFIFQNINLHSGGHGNILLKVKSKNTLVQGNTVSKKASIYFDYNAPIITNNANTVFQSLSNPDVAIDASIAVYPNPSKGNVTITCKNNINSIQLFDVQGRILQTDIVNETSKVIDISEKQNGLYFIKVITDKGIKVEKVMKE